MTAAARRCLAVLMCHLVAVAALSGPARAADERAGRLVDAAWLQQRLGQVLLIDASVTSDHAAGHVPAAMSMPSSDLFDAERRFKPASELQRLLRYAGIGPGQTVHTHCGGGGAAAVNWFALTFIAGHPKVTLYQESQHEWLRDERGLPFWTHARPPLMREAAWLAGWNAPMLRHFGVAELGIVDVRPPEAYARGHVPFAVNVPAATLRAQWRQPERLAATLGGAGLDPAQDAVIVSDGGLTRDAALAFVALDQAGHPKVSVLMSSVDDWALDGQTLARRPTVVGQPADPQDLAVAPVDYPVPGEGRAVVADPARTRGEFPKVFVAAGASPPAAARPEGSVVHLPAAELLGADGRPKPAAALWKRIDAAGVPRHAELILFADDPGDASIGYFVFRLMGWPDVKVWAE